MAFGQEHNRNDAGGEPWWRVAGRVITTIVDCARSFGAAADAPANVRDDAPVDRVHVPVRTQVDRKALAEALRQRSAAKEERTARRDRTAPPVVRYWDFARARFNPRSHVLFGLDPELVDWFEEHQIMPVALYRDSPKWMIRAELEVAFGGLSFGRDRRERGGRDFGR